jgi:hypothetical protein
MQQLISTQRSPGPTGAFVGIKQLGGSFISQRIFLNLVFSGFDSPLSATGTSKVPTKPAAR